MIVQQPVHEIATAEQVCGLGLYCWPCTILLLSWALSEDNWRSDQNRKVEANWLYEDVLWVDMKLTLPFLYNIGNGNFMSTNINHVCLTIFPMTVTSYWESMYSKQLLRRLARSNGIQAGLKPAWSYRCTAAAPRAALAPPSEVSGCDTCTRSVCSWSWYTGPKCSPYLRG